MARTSKTSGTKKTTASRARSTTTKKAPAKTKSAAAAVPEKKTTASARNTKLGTKLNPNRLLAELAGTFALTLVVIAALSGKFTLSFFASPEVTAQATQAGQSIPAFGIMPFVAGLAVAVLVFATYKISGGHLNPAITAGQMALRRMKVTEGVGYIVAQLLGAMLALSVAVQLVTTLDSSTGSMTALDPAELFSHTAGWQVFFAELLGAFVFGFAAAAALAYRALPRAVVLGGGFLLGIGVALMAGAGILNPALAVGVGLVGFGENAWAMVGIYLAGSTLGVLVGMAFHAMLNRDVPSEPAKA